MNSNDQLSILFKKYQGYVNTATNAAVGVEYPVLANSTLLSQYFCAQQIPSVPPSITDTNVSQPPNVVKKYVGTGDYFYIAFYDTMTLTRYPPNSYYYVSSGNPNLLTNVIPQNTDPLGGYALTVKNNGIQLPQQNYNLDIDAGMLTLYGVSSPGTITISFWRYEGLFGLGGTGYTGAAGITGPTGMTGLQGQQGPQGLQGVQGQQGPQGVEGAQGPQGLEGSQGPQGTQGLFGYQGQQGPQGPTSLHGPQGAQGVQGHLGNQGPEGTTGFQGNQGPISTQGPQGHAGFQGIQGPQGLQGSDEGPQGFQGNEGMQGQQGLHGSQGSLGLQGLQGVQGTLGVFGVQGRQANQGPQGNRGPQGFGFQGRQGVRGPQGLLGSQGPQGPQGTQGRIGNTQVQGPQGSQGNSGQFSVQPATYTIGINATITSPSTLNSTNNTLSFSDVDLLGYSTSNILNVLLASVQAKSPVYIYIVSNSGRYIYISTSNSIATYTSNTYTFTNFKYTNGFDSTTQQAVSPLIFTSNQQIILSYIIEGVQGPQGYQGDLIPIPGNIGFDGLKGPANTIGYQGLPGDLGTINENGPAGPNGINGVKGVPGSSIVPVEIGPQGYQGPFSSTLLGLYGPLGDTGYQGPQGNDPIGSQGVKGIQGPQGIDRYLFYGGNGVFTDPGIISSSFPTQGILPLSFTTDVAVNGASANTTTYTYVILPRPYLSPNMSYMYNIQYHISLSSADPSGANSSIVQPQASNDLTTWIDLPVMYISLPENNDPTNCIITFSDCLIDSISFASWTATYFRLCYRQPYPFTRVNDDVSNYVIPSTTIRYALSIVPITLYKNSVFS